jgi:two-component sensor histidine kinase
MQAFDAVLDHDVESRRLAAVRRYDVLDTPPDGAFDRITAIAARRFEVPISLISIVDADRIFLKSHHGLPIDQVGRDEGLCATTILSAHPRVLPDAKADACALTNPLVAGDAGLRFYAGVPLTTHDGYHLGALCVVDMAPRPVAEAEIADLTDLAAVVMDELELRLAARAAIGREQMLRREIDHRVTNSLQFISSMLEMQGGAPGLTEGAHELRIAAGRVAAVARVHRHFCNHIAERVSCLLFLRGLCGDLAEILGRPIRVSGDEGEVPAALIQPVGLIANELITNAAKYGSGTIDVVLLLGAGSATLSVRNEGGKLPAGFDPDRSSGFGMRVVGTLLRQLHGRLTAGALESGDGACFTAVFPV